MAKDIDSDKIVISKVFNLWFKIPNYQRPYVWEADQVQTLLEDTFDAFVSNCDAQYFLGSLVLKTNSKKEEDGVEYNEYEILDGQQRLTTVLLFFAILRDLTKDNQIKEICSNKVFQEENDFENRPERMRIVFDIRQEVRDFVDKYIKTEGATANAQNLKDFEKFADDKKINISIRNMSKAILTIREFLEAHEQDVPKFFKFFINKVLMIYVATEQLEDAFQLFTVLNNRGVKLNNSDILKALNLKEVNSNTLRDSWGKKWEEMETYFGENFDQFLSNIRTIIVKRKALYSLLKEFDDNIYAAKLLSRGLNTFEYIYNFYEIYREVFDDDHFGNIPDLEISNYLKFMRAGLATDYWVAPVLEYYNRFKDDNFKEFLKQLDKKISADWIIALSPTKRIESVNKILVEIEKSNTSADVIASDVFNIDVDEFKRVMELDLYGKRYAKYILLKLDLLYLSSSTKFNPPSTISIEHILPQNPPDNPQNQSQWRIDFTDQEREEWIDKLGNLILLSRKKNTSQGNKDYTLKKEKYFKKNVEVFPNSVRVFNQYNVWTPAELKANHDEVMKKLLAEYKN